jgi:hypothetical protein
MNTVIYVLGYNRPQHLLSTLLGLSKQLNNYSGKRKFQVEIRIDGSKDGLINQDILNVLERFNYPYMVSPKNFGLRSSILSVLGCFKASEYDSMILLEDDILISDDCLVYFDNMLMHYEHDSKILQISAYSPFNFNSSFVFRHPRISTWGWATWKHKFPLLDDFVLDWRGFNVTAFTASQIQMIEEYMPDTIGLFDSMQSGKINAWSLDLLTYSVRNNLKTIYPSSTLLDNIGMDGTGENCGKRKSFNLFVEKKHLLNLQNLLELETSKSLIRKFNRYYSRNRIWKIYRMLYGI